MSQWFLNQNGAGLRARGAELDDGKGEAEPHSQLFITQTYQKDEQSGNHLRQRFGLLDLRIT